MSTNNSSDKILIAFVGMPGAGKSEAVAYIEKKNIPFIRFGDLTDQQLIAHNLEINPDVLDRENKEVGETADIQVGAALLDNAQAVDIIPSATGAEEDDDELSLRE